MTVEIFLNPKFKIDYVLTSCSKHNLKCIDLLLCNIK